MTAAAPEPADASVNASADWRAASGSASIQRVGAYGLVLEPGASDRRLLMVRLTERTPYPGAWSLPGGQVEIGEHPQDCLVRELHEETGLTGRVLELLDVASQVRDFYEPSTIRRVFHAIRILYRMDVDAAGPLVVHDADGSSDSPTWVPVGEVGSLHLTPVGELALRHLAGPGPSDRSAPGK